MKTKFSMLFLILSFICYGQKKTEKVQLNLSVPVTIKMEKKTVNFNTGNTVHDNKEENKFIQIHANLDDMYVNGTKFKGTSITKFPVYEEIVTFEGEYSSDFQKISTLNVNYQYVKYSQERLDLAYLEETREGSFTFKNIPKSFNSFKFEAGISQITKADYKLFRYVKYVGSSEMINESSMSLNKDAITRYTRCVTMKVSPSNVPPSKSSAHQSVAVTLNQHKKYQEFNEGIGTQARIMEKLIQEFSGVEELNSIGQISFIELRNSMGVSEDDHLVTTDDILPQDHRLEADILVIVQCREIFYDDSDIVTGFHIQPLFLEKSSGKVFDPKLDVRIIDNDKKVRQEEFLVHSIFLNVMKKYFHQL